MLGTVLLLAVSPCSYCFGLGFVGAVNYIKDKYQLTCIFALASKCNLASLMWVKASGQDPKVGNEKIQK